ncbi:MAG TPA: heavy metal translocating P-type ATPase [Povalibacter sp.]|uniref:heavy metal translocating P-type ATPase n=1 Tax=Povalibacter sp. TaxID=1962978 RepID=UPI002B921D67|nr:heavy metal translocating P-type ATPase [Povalibacter sp.]HMN43073.1 heavy metal translocating P-type ATPase [Povalibacter sp.]
MTIRDNACWHCGEPVPADVVIHTRIGGETRTMCCQGCRAAAEWIQQIGLGDYYRLRTQSAPRPEVAASTADWQRAEIARHVVRDLGDGRRETMLLVEGIRCSACVWLIERALGGLPGMMSVQVNAVAQRARVVWNDARIGLPQILDHLARTGYRAQPLDARALDDVRRRESRAAMKRLLVAGFGSMQSMMYAAVLYFGGDDTAAGTHELFRWLGFLVATPVVFYSARPFFAGATRSLAARQLGMDVPVAAAIAIIYAASLIEALQGGVHVYFDSVSMFVFFLLTGRYIEMRARHRAGDLTDALARLTPPFAERRRADAALERVGIHELRVDDVVHVVDGGIVPADGTLLDERCRVDESLLSGESLPVVRQRGAMLIAGSLLIDGPVDLRVARVGADTTLAGIAALVERARTQRPRLARAGERAAARLVARILAVTALTAAAWSFFDPSRAFAASLAVLVVSCPCAFALAVPAAITRVLAVLARRGVLVVKPDAIEALAGATHVVFDKTGTLTEPQLALAAVQTFGVSREQALCLAASLARESRHPSARAIAAAWDSPLSPPPLAGEGQGGGEAGTAASGLPPSRPSHPQSLLHASGGRGQNCNVIAHAGLGISACIAGRTLRLGRPDFALSGNAGGIDDDCVVLADDHGPIAAFRLDERLRANARATVDALKAQGLTVLIASGDAEAKVTKVAAQLGITEWHARQLPSDKLDRLTALRAAGARVIVVGDGVNDAPVLAGADVAISLSTAAELAQASSDIVLTVERFDALAPARTLARQTLAIVQQNQRWALVYNLTAVPIAALGFVPPWLAAIGMSLSSLCVVLNALRIGREPATKHAPHSAALLRTEAA